MNPWKYMSSNSIIIRYVPVCRAVRVARAIQLLRNTPRHPLRHTTLIELSVTGEARQLIVWVSETRDW